VPLGPGGPTAGTGTVVTEPSEPKPKPSQPEPPRPEPKPSEPNRSRMKKFGPSGSRTNAKGSVAQREAEPWTQARSQREEQWSNCSPQKSGFLN